MSFSTDPRFEELRKRAEALCEREPADVARMSPEAIQALVHDLQVHQMELEIQNDELRKTQEALERSRDRYSQLYHQAPAGYVTLDGGGTIRRVNDAFARMMGDAPEGLTRRPFAGLIDPDDRSVFLARYKAFFKFPEGKVIDVRLLRKDGEVRHAMLEGGRAIAAPSEMEGDEGTLFMIVRDVTAQKEAEQRLKEHERRMTAAQKMESLGVMAGAVAHHFNNLLHVVMGNLDLARDGGSDAVDFIDNAESAARRAADLSQSMLTYIGQNPGVKKPVNLAEHCRRMLPLFQAALPERVRLSARFPDRMPLVMADLSQIQQLLMNLATNAAEAMDDDAGGEIRLSLEGLRCDPKSLGRRVFQEDLPDGAYICLTVSDTGSGMDPQTLDRIFEPFFTTKFTGRGMGLAVAMGVVRGHGGTLSVESAPGTGTVVKVLLPAMEEAATGTLS